MSLTNLKNDCVLAKTSNKDVWETSVAVEELKVPVRFKHSVCCVGPRSVGKTTLCKNLLYTLLSSAKVAPHVVIVTNEADKDGFKGWSNNIHSEVNDEFFDRIIKYQKRAIKNQTVKDLVLVLDDVIVDANIPKFRDIVLHGRHLHITLILTVQYMLLAPIIQSSIDLWFARGQTRNSEKQSLWQQVWGHHSTFAKFNNIFSDICSEPWTWVCTSYDQHESQTYWFTSRLISAPTEEPAHEVSDLEQVLNSPIDSSSELKSLRDELNVTISAQIKIRERLDALLK